jgi:Zn-dependent protease with chaperone function
MTVIAGTVAWVLVHLSWRASQRAEYLADHLSAEVAGSAGTVDMLSKLEYAGVFASSVESAGIRSLSGAQMMDEYAAAAAARPHPFPGENGSESAGEREDRTHPPTASRIAFVQARPEVARMTFSYGDSQAIDAELAPFRDKIGNSLVSGFRERTYGHV